MIAAWMVGSTVFALLLGIAAYATERALRLTKRATRTPWVVALILAVVWPALAPVVLRQVLGDNPATTLVVGGDAASPATFIADQLPATSATWEELVPRVLLAVWVLLSLLMTARLIFAALALSRVTRDAKEVHLDGGPVLVTESLGPAVIGLWTPRVAVPEWFLQLDTSLRTLVLRHEREHCASRDPQLVWLASLAVAVMPWNVGVWFLSRRLRLALEIDCDSRTLEREANTERYGKLLLLIAQRQSSYPLAAMLAESTSHLSRRIRAMQMIPLQKPLVRVAACALVATGAIAVACSPRVASDLTGPNSRPTNASTLAAKQAAELASGGQVFFESQVEKPVMAAPGSTGPLYPAELKAQGKEGQVMAMFVVNEQGLAEASTIKVLRTDDPQFEAAVRTALPLMKFVPAEIGGKVVKQLVQQPFQFALGTAKAGAVKPAILPRQSALTLEQKQMAERLARDAGNGRGALAEPVQTTATPLQRQPAPMSATFKSGAGPKYPAALRATGVDGTVVAMFVINQDGTPDMGSLKIVQTDHEAFTNAVKDALPGMLFEAPTKDGKAVRQLTQQRFDFRHPTEQK